MTLVGGGKVQGLDVLIGSELNCLVFYPFPSQYDKNITSLSLVQVYCFHQILQQLKLFVGSMMEIDLSNFDL